MTLTVDQVRDLTGSTLDDASIELLLDSAAAEIARYAGEAGARTEYVDGQGRFITTHHPIGSVASITETRHATTTTLATTDYLVRSACVVERLRTGDNPRSYWYDRVAITYTPEDDEAIRDVVQLDLVALMLNTDPGLTSETVGSWTRQIGSNSSWNASEERAAILARLDVGPELAVVG